MAAIPAIFANTGTPLVWASMGQLLFGNIFIGVLEGWLIARLFGIPRAVIPAMIGANYLSLVPGMLLLPALSAAVAGGIEPNVYTAPAYMTGMCALLFVLSAIVEWPICFAILGRRPRRFRDSWLASLAAQAASYAVLVAYYGAASDFSIYTEVDVTRSLVPSLPSNAVVYFLSPEADSLWRVRLDGREPEKVADVPQEDRTRPDPWRLTDRAPCLAAELEAGQNVYRLWFKDDERSHAIPAPRIPAGAWRFADVDEDRPWETRELRAPAERSVEVWAIRGLAGLELTGSVQFRLRLETPFLSWRAREPTVLPGDLVVFEMARQILVLDVRARKLGLLARGRAPLVAVEREPALEGSADTSQSPAKPRTASTASLPSG